MFSLSTLIQHTKFLDPPPPLHPLNQDIDHLHLKPEVFMSGGIIPTTYLSRPGGYFLRKKLHILCFLS